MFTSISRQTQTLGDEENLPAFHVMHVIFQNTQKIGKHDLFIFIALGVAAFSFSNCTEELSLRFFPLTLEGHSNIEDEEKRADRQENGRTRKGRRKRMPWSTATALCLSSANQCWVRVHESYSDWLI